MIKKTYHISGFDCPNCAHKSEAHLGKHEKVDSCHIDFSTNKMYITYKEEELEVEEIKKVIAQAISELPEKEKMVIVLYYHEDLTFKEIGEVLEVSESRISQLHTKANLRLRAKLTNLRKGII